MFCVKGGVTLFTKGCEWVGEYIHIHNNTFSLGQAPKSKVKQLLVGLYYLTIPVMQKNLSCVYI